jgi:hypothetical protein
MWYLARVACLGRGGAAARKVLFSSPQVKKLFLEDLSEALEAYMQAAKTPGAEVTRVGAGSMHHIIMPTAANHVAVFSCCCMLIVPSVVAAGKWAACTAGGSKGHAFRCDLQRAVVHAVCVVASGNICADGAARCVHHGHRSGTLLRAVCRVYPITAHLCLRVCRIPLCLPL